jgi:hypothetical protein
MSRLPFHSLESHFWFYVDKDPAPDACWLWQGTITPYGYGRMKHHKIQYTAHRLAWILANGPIPEGLQVCHHCDIRGCVRNDGQQSHLFLGTAAKNAQDRNRKGRHAHGLRHFSSRHPERLSRGDSHWAAKLSETIYPEICLAYAQGNITQTALAKQYGIAQTTISSIIRHKARRPLILQNQETLPALLTEGLCGVRTQRHHPGLRIWLLCQYCENPFLVHRYRETTAKYCSHACHSRKSLGIPRKRYDSSMLIS